MFLAAAIICAVALLLTVFITGAGYEVWLLSGGQLALLVAMIRQKHVTGVTMFMFMSFLFFGIRPIYILLESDLRLFDSPFFIEVDGKILNSAQWWGTFALLCYFVGARLPGALHRERWRRMRRLAQKPQTRVIVSEAVAYAALAYQVVSLGIMFALSGMGSLYGTGAGAWLYDLPALLQGGQIFAVAVLLERYWKLRSSGSLTMLIVSSVFFLSFTYQMRDVSLFRGFYLTGLLAGGVAVASRIRSQVNALWLIVPIVLVFPLFKILGQIRTADNGELTEQLAANLRSEEKPFVNRYWDFYDSSGDINIFDTFVAAKEAEPAFYPYALSWLYVPVHWIPRAIWKSKPESGILMDVSFTNGAPYSPGISGFFLLDGGLIWMLGCMVLLGYLMGYGDAYILSLPVGYLRNCLYGIFVVTSMGGSRYFLYQYFYQMLYAAVPVVVLSWLVLKIQEKRLSEARTPRRRARTAAAPVSQTAPARAGRGNGSIAPES